MADSVSSPPCPTSSTVCCTGGTDDVVVVVKQQQGRTKVIGPFDGNNNNDGDMMSSSKAAVQMSQETLVAVAVASSRKQEKMELNMSIKNGATCLGSLKNTPTSSPSRARKNLNSAKNSQQTHTIAKDGKKQSSPDLDGFDVYNIETALPKIDWEAMEAHLRAAREEERRRRNDREEIRRRLAMGIDSEEDADRLQSRKQSLQSRLQSNMNLQICFMNETASDGSDSEAPGKETENLDSGAVVESGQVEKNPAVARELFSSLPTLSTFKSTTTGHTDQGTELDFFAQQAKLQIEARTALAQAKELARIQMQVERQQRKRSLISDLVRQNLEKLGLPFAWDLRRLSRQVVSELSVAQLQVIVNDLHTQIEGLNEELVQQLMQRDDHHMEQDSMLVDIEDLTRYLTAKQQSLLLDTPNNSGHSSMPVAKSNQSSPSPKQGLRSLRLPSLRKS